MTVVVTLELLKPADYAGYSVHVLRKSYVIFGITVWETVKVI